MTKEERLLHLMGQISDEIIDEVYSDSKTENYYPQKKKKFTIIYKYRFYISAATIACILIFGMPVIYKNINRNSSISPEKKPVETTFSVDIGRFDNTLLYFNSSVYDVYDVRNKDLPSKGVNLSAKVNIGERISYLDIVDNTLHPSQKSTEIELFTYSSIESEAVYIIKDDGTYYYAFHSFYEDNGEADKMNFATILDTYGIYSADNLSSISYSRDEKEYNIDSKESTDYFYNMCVSLVGITPSEFTETEYKDKSPEEIGILDAEKEENCIPVTITSADGLKFSIYYYPTCGWLYSDATQRYYQPDDAQQAWLEEHLK